VALPLDGSRMKRTSLKAWLRREPAPDKVVVRLEDGEERDIAIPADIRNRWKTVETSVLASGAVAVQLFNKKGTLLRGQAIEPEDDDDDEPADPAEKAVQAQDKTLKQWTAMIASVMHEQNVSFEKGVQAASQSQSSLVDIVDNLAQHFASALTNIYNIVSNMAIVQEQHAEQVAGLTKQLAEARSEGSGSGGAIERIAGAVLAGAMAPQPKPEASPNGHKKGGK
jgi:hypothetical protein